MRVAPDRRLTVDEFLEYFAHKFDHAELVNGEIYLMAGGSARHALIATNILTALRTKLRGSGCRPVGSNMGLRIDATTLRYPDVAVYCDPRDLDGDLGARQFFQHPRAIFEILSPSTKNFDKNAKAFEYKRLESTRFIAILDPDTQVIETFTWVAPGRWHNLTHMPGVDLVLTDPAVTLTTAEIFASD